MNLEDVQSHLEAVIAGSNPGELLIITKDGEPVATLTRNPPPKTWPSQVGCAKTDGYWMAPDFDAPLEEFREFME